MKQGVDNEAGTAYDIQQIIQHMIRRFPLLQAFVAVVRAGRMKEAADVLGVTPGAVSQRIRQLEEIVGQPLFTRTREGVELTASGTEMFAALAQPFAAIEAIDRDLDSGSTRKRVVVNTMPSLAATWLVPRLNSFIRLSFCEARRPSKRLATA